MGYTNSGGSAGRASVVRVSRLRQRGSAWVLEQMLLAGDVVPKMRCGGNSFCDGEATHCVSYLEGGLMQVFGMLRGCVRPWADWWAPDFLAWRTASAGPAHRLHQQRRISGPCVGCQGVWAASAWVSVGQRGCSSTCCWLETWCRRCGLWREGVDEVVAHDDAMAVAHDDAMAVVSDDAMAVVSDDAMADEEPQDDNAVKAKDGEATVDVAELFERLDRIADPQRRSVVQVALEGLLGPRRKRNEGADCGRRAKRPRVVVVGDNHIRRTASCAVCS
jgi:hypothetical protein